MKTVPCHFCGSDQWQLREVHPGREEGTIRVRVYAHPENCGCTARMYTHEVICEHATFQLLSPTPLDKRPGRRVVHDETPCPACGHAAYHHVATYAPDEQEPGLFALHAYHCKHCGSLMYTRESLRGISPAPTPRERRSHRSHPLR